MKLHNLNTRKNFKIKNLCLCIGNFDGVHLGHQHLIKKIIKNAKLNQLRSAILTFVPHPKIYFNRTSDNFNIIMNDDKKKLLNLLGVEHYIEYKFNKLLSSLNPESFIKKILVSGFHYSKRPIKIIKINKRVKIEKEDKFISIEPNKLSLDIDFELKYNNQIIGNQKNKINVYEDDLKEIFESRTFCLFEDIEKIKENGLAKGGSLDNAIVVKDNEIMNTEKLRNTKEFVNHKILDCIGDLYTSGYRIIASITCSQGGHFLTNQLLKKVFENKENFSIIEIQERNLPHTIINKNLLRSIA